MPTNNEHEVLQSWIGVLNACGACCANLLPALQALSALRLKPHVLQAIIAAQEACASPLALVDVLPKPVSFCAALTRCILALHQAVVQPLMPRQEAEPRPSTEPDSQLHRQVPMLEHVQPSKIESASKAMPAQEAPGKEKGCDSASDDSGADHHPWQKEWNHLNLHNPYALQILDYAKDVASCVERSRVLAKSTQCQPVGAAADLTHFSLATSVVEEHRELVMSADVWQILATDVGLRCFLSEKTGYAAGIVDEVPITLHIFNDAILAKEQAAQPTPSLRSSSSSRASPPGAGAEARDQLLGDVNQRARGQTNSSLLFLLGASVKVVTCALAPSQKTSHRPSTSMPARVFKKDVGETGGGADRQGVGFSHVHALNACAARRRRFIMTHPHDL